MFACTFLSLLQILSTEIMEADDKKTEDLHIVPGVVPTMDEYHCHSSNGSSCSSSNHRNAPLHKNGIHAAVTWSYCAPKLGSDILLQCQSPSVASSDHNHSASDVSGEETDFDELGDLLRRFGKFDFYIYHSHNHNSHDHDHRRQHLICHRYHSHILFNGDRGQLRRP